MKPTKQSSTLHIEDLAVSIPATRRHADQSALPIVRGINLTIRRGSVLALIGASGSGKSTICSATLGTLDPGLEQTSGRILIDGAPVFPRDIRGRLITTVMQNPRSAFNPVRTMGDHATETLAVLPQDRSRTEADRTDLIHRTLHSVGLDDSAAILPLYPFQMSGGMLQRMMIALALLADAPFLLADEPTTDLDLVVQKRVLDLLVQAQADRGLGMLLVTHDMGVVARMADEVAILHQGEIVEQGAVEQIFHHPAHPVTRTLVTAHLALYGLEASQ